MTAVPGTARPPRLGAGRADAGIWLAGLVLGALGLGGYLFWALHGGLVRDGNWVGVDFHVYYLAARVLRGGGDIYHAGIAPPYVYPPLLAALVVPLAGLPVAAATIAWKALQQGCLLLAGGLLVSLLPGRVRPLAAGLLLLGLLTVPLHDEIQVGESNSLVLALEAGALWLIARKPTGDWFAPAAAAAGGLLALAAGIKVLPVLLIAYFWWRGPRPVAAWATGGFLAIQEALVILTPTTLDYWLRQFPALFGQAFPYLDNQSLNAAIARALLPPDPGTIPLQLASGEAWRPVLTWVANMLVLVGAAGALYRAGRAGGGTGRAAGAIPLLLEAGLVLLTTHLVSGSTWLHHLVDLAVPLVAVLGVWWAARTAAPTAGRGAAPARWRRLDGALIGGLLGAFILLAVRPADWVALVGGLLPGHPFPAWVAANSALGVVLGGWVGMAGLLARPAGRALAPPEAAAIPDRR